MQTHRKQFFILAIVFTIFLGTISHAFGCGNNPISNRIIEERDRAVEEVLIAWLDNAPMDSLIENISVIISNEFSLSALCRKDFDFLNTKLILLLEKPMPPVESVPGILLEHQVGAPVLDIDPDFLIIEAADGGI